MDESNTGVTGLIFSINATSAVSYTNCYKNIELNDKKSIFLIIGTDHIPYNTASERKMKKFPLLRQKLCKIMH